jgi:hypothetical protein
MNKKLMSIIGVVCFPLTLVGLVLIVAMSVGLMGPIMIYLTNWVIAPYF